VQIKNRQKLLIVVALSAVVLFVGDLVLIEPLAKSWSTRAKRIATLRTQIEQSKRLLDRERPIRNHWADWQHKTLTNNPSVADQQVFQAIDRWAQETGVTIAAITPQWKHDSDDYNTYECRIDATGDIRRLSRFLYDVEREPMAFKLDSIELGARDKEGQQLSLGLQLSALVLNPQAK
jgi:Tfp pilus assembly protein PilO